MALRLLSKHNTIEKVIESLETNKLYKDRVPENYLAALKRVQALFFYQTVYDTRICKLASLEELPELLAKDIEPSFLGDRTVIESNPEILIKFATGLLNKHTLKARETYSHVMDIKRLKDDYRMNSVNERSFVCIDRSFFATGFSLSEPILNKRGGQPSNNQEEEVKNAPAKSFAPKRQVDDDDLGFCFESDSEPEPVAAVAEDEDGLP